MIYVVGPSEVDLSYSDEMNDGEETSLMCKVIGANPIVHPTWSGFENIEHQISVSEVRMKFYML